MLYYYILWHTGHSETAELIVTPLLARLVHHAIVLTVHALSSGTLAFLTKIHDGLLGSIHSVDLDLVEGVLDGLDGHVVFP